MIPLTFINRFERELKAKLSQKATVHNTEENTLLKAFKYFDLDNNGTILYDLLIIVIGTCELDEFQKALEKIGVTIPNKKDLNMLFNYYDSDGSGSLDYKEFTQILLGKDGNNMERKSQ